MASTESPATPPEPRAFLASLRGRLDRRAGAHLYRQVADLVRQGIYEGALGPGASLPPQRELSGMWAIGEVTVRRALQALADEGLLEARAGSGTVVRGAAERDAADAPRSAGLTLGIAFADLAHGYPFFAPLLQGIRDAERPVAVRLFDMPEGELATGSLAHAPPLGDLDGLLMMSPVNLQLLAACQRRGLPTVLLYSDIMDGFSRCILVDYARGIRQAVAHLVERGRSRVALVTAGEERFSAGQMVDAYTTALEAAGLATRSAWVIHTGYLEGEGYHAARKLMALPEPPDAILFASDQQARGGLLAAQELGLDVPGTLAIVGAGHVLGPEAWPVALTTIDLRLNEVGALARRTVAAMVAGERPPARQSVASRLIVGGTS